MTSAIEHDQAALMRNAIDMVEEAYEFMLAYAAQGRRQETQESGASKIRDYMTRLAAALDDMQAATPSVLGEPSAAAFRDRFANDLAVVRSVVALVLARPSITSDMVDNTNALVALRAFMTDLFFIDQTILPPR